MTYASAPAPKGITPMQSDPALVVNEGKKLRLDLSRFVPEAELPFISSRRKRRIMQEISDIIGSLMMVAMHTHRTIVVANEKGGGGKSPLIALLAGVYCFYLKFKGVIIDYNPSMGTLDLDLGIDRGRTLNVDQALHLREQLMYSDVLEEMTQIHFQSGLRYITNSKSFKPELLTVDNLRELLESLHRYSTTFVDNGPDTLTAHNKASFQAADAVVFSGLWSDDTSMNGVVDAMRKLVLRDMNKVRRQSLVVINGVPKGVTKDEVFDRLATASFRLLRKQVKDAKGREIIDPEKRKQAIAEELRTTGQKNINDLAAKYILLDKEHLFLIPENEAIKAFSTQNDTVMDVSIKALGAETLKSLLEILFFIFDGIVLEDRPQFPTENVTEREFEELHQVYETDVPDPFVSDEVPTIMVSERKELS